MSDIAVSVVVATRNRASLLAKTLASVSAQDIDPALLELIVVDNGSPDVTEPVIRAYARRASHRIRYLRESRLGKSFALNHGLDFAGGRYLAIVDDDQQIRSDYVRRAMTLLDADPRLAAVGGRVLPVFEGSPPRWLTRAHWSPLGLADYGPEPLAVGPGRRICLLTPVFRTEALLAIGGFGENFSVAGDRIGGIEDEEILDQLWAAGWRGLYHPDLYIEHYTPASRVRREYHRRWHEGHGRFAAIRGDQERERSRFRILGVPAFMVRQACLDAAAYVWHRVRHPDSEQRYVHEHRLLEFRGFSRQRVADRLRRTSPAGRRTPPLAAAASPQVNGGSPTAEPKAADLK